MNKKVLLILIIVVMLIIVALTFGLGYILITNTSLSDMESAVFDDPINYPQVSNLNELVVKDIISSLKEDDGKLYIPVKKDDKYIFIDEKGNKLIDDEFDMATEFVKFKISDDKVYAIACVYKNGKKLVINEDNSVLFELKNPRDLNGLETDVKYSEVGETLDDLITVTLSGKITSVTTLSTNKDQTFAKNISTTCKQIKKVNNKFDYSDKYYIEQEEVSNNTFEAYAKNPKMYDSYEKYIKAKDKKIINYNYYLVSKESEGNKLKLDCEDLFIKNDILYIYDNGNIPFISPLSNESGWFNSEGKKTTLKNASMRVVQTKNNAIIVVEPYKLELSYTKSKVSEDEYNNLKQTITSEDTKTNQTIYTVYALGIEGSQKTGKEYKIVYMTSDGYILKNLDTGKYYVLDSDFKVLYEDGFDIITPYLLDKGYIIAGNKQDNETQSSSNSTYKAPKNYKYKIYDFKGNTVSSDEYDELYATISFNTLETSFENAMITTTSVMKLNDNINNKLLYRQLYIDKLDEQEADENSNYNNSDTSNNDNNN